MEFDKMNSELKFVSTFEEDLVDIDAMLETIQRRSNQTVSIVDAENPENSQLYTYNKFLEIFDTDGLNGFIV